MMDYYIYKNVNNLLLRFILLYIIYAICFFGVCYMMRFKLDGLTRLKFLGVMVIIIFLGSLRYNKKVIDN